MRTICSFIALLLLSLSGYAGVDAGFQTGSPFDRIEAEGMASWSAESRVNRGVTESADIQKLEERAAALERDAAALLAENSRLRDEAERFNFVGEISADAPDAIKQMAVRFDLLLAQYRAATEKLAESQLECRRLDETLRKMKGTVGMDKVRADSAENVLDDQRVELVKLRGTLASERKQSATQTAIQAKRTAAIEAENDLLREKMEVIESLVERLNPERTIELEQGIRDRDALLREAAEKLKAKEQP